ncbi:hypothetical protein CFC21_073282 [Triticum aestivum]|uniref:Wall-associated receptor kinase galacturonan-binding domain-containing protein n=2 Tax=Triticum aestivum TaxID=4565 RepID=A0A3B6LSF3_WHEAT|nr:hypothetical protein CFC21_073282 [Triticum aestivum]
MAHHTTIVFSAAAALLLLLLPPCAGAAAAPVPVIGMPGCETRCGDMVVPYPFGMGPSYCYLPGFNLTCDWLSDPPRLLLGDGTLQVAEDIGYPSDATLAVVYAGNIPTDGNGQGRLGGGLGDGGPYALPPAGNQLVLVGCNVRATLRSGNLTMSSCSSFCHDGRTSYMKSGKSSMLCSGMGCCQAPIVVNREVAAGGKLVPITSYDVEIECFGRNRSDGQRWPARVFVAKKGWITTWSASKQLSSDPQAAADMEVPLWLNWEVIDGDADDTGQLQRSKECPKDAARRICKSNHTRCTRGDRGGYLCSCKQGYQGNAYITNGCQG